MDARPLADMRFPARASTTLLLELYQALRRRCRRRLLLRRRRQESARELHVEGVAAAYLTRGRSKLGKYLANVAKTSANCAKRLARFRLYRHRIGCNSEEVI